MSKRQSCIAILSAEIGYLSTAYASQELLWIVKLLAELILQQQLPVTTYKGNQLCIKLLESENIPEKTSSLTLNITQ